MAIAADLVDLGLIDYGAALSRQRELVERRLRGEVRDTVLFCQHPDVITMGRRQAARLNIRAERFPVYEVERGGDVTYHGPGQLVGYPILLLEGAERDLHRYLRSLETALIALCAECGVPAGRREGLTGVWTADGRRKIASIGIAVRRWITFHGFALNVTTDLAGFGAINPCGLEPQVMASLQGLGGSHAGQPLRVAALVEPAARHLGAALGRDFSTSGPHPPPAS